MARNCIALVWATVFTVAAGAQLSAAEMPGQEVVIQGHVVDAEMQQPPREPVTVTYREHGGADHEPVFAETDSTGRFRFAFEETGMGQFGLLSVRELGYNSALQVWPVPVDTDVVLYLSKPVGLHGTIVNESGMPASGARVKWSMTHDGRLASGVGAVNEEGFFHVYVPSRTDNLRIAAWADYYAPARAHYTFDVDGGAPQPTVLRTLESRAWMKSVEGGVNDRYLQDWVDEILLAQDTQEPPR